MGIEYHLTCWSCQPKAIVWQCVFTVNWVSIFSLYPCWSCKVDCWFCHCPLLLLSVIKDWGHACAAHLVLKKYFKLVSLLMFISDNFWPYGGDAAEANSNSDERRDSTEPCTNKVTGSFKQWWSSCPTKKGPLVGKCAVLTQMKCILYSLCVHVHKRFSLWETAWEFTSGPVIQVRCLTQHGQASTLPK